MTNNPTELEPKYYLGHFNHLLAFVRHHYGALLTTAENDVLTRFDTLSEDARCLLIRFSNRRRRYFRAAKLHYPELASVSDCLAELRHAGMIAHPGEADDDLAALLGEFTVAELRALTARLTEERPPAARKTELVAALAGLSHDRVIAAINARELLIQPRHADLMQLLKFLFFGTPYQSMEQFVIRDLGYARFEDYDPLALRPRFTSRREVDDVLYVWHRYDEFRALRNLLEPAAVLNKVASWLEQRERLHPGAWPRLERLAVKLGRWLERQAEPELALRGYRFARQPPARERQVRLLAKLGRHGPATALCREILAAPCDPAERLFAADFLARRAGRTRLLSTTRALKAAASVGLDPGYRRRVEWGVLEHFRAQGYQGRFSENYLWRGLFGLLLWEQLFDPAAGTIHQPLQRAPSDLYQENFLPTRRAQIERRLRLLDDPQRCLTELRQRLADKWGVNNPLVNWHHDLEELLTVCCRRLSGAQLRTVMLELAANVGAHGSGFPDLLVWRDTPAEGGGDYCFIEVKAPGDQLRPQQLHWLRVFRRCRIPVRLLKVHWLPAPSASDGPPAADSDCKNPGN